MDNIFTLLQLSSTIGMCYVGWRSKKYIKSFINSTSIKPYKNMIGFKSSNMINEDMFCGITGSLTGILIGRLVWPIGIPISLLVIENDYGKDIRKFLSK